MRRVSKIIQAFYYTGDHTSTVFPGAGAFRERMAPARRDRDDKQRDTPSRAVSLAAWRLLELGMQRCGYDGFKLFDVLHPENGKPSWSQAVSLPAERRVDFSISHARGIAMCAIAAGLVIGCDVEERARIQPRLTRRLTPDHAPRLPCWTELEAVTKATGLGIMHGHEIVWTLSDATLQGKRWWCYPVDCGVTYAAHVAADAPDVQVIVNNVLEL